MEKTFITMHDLSPDARLVYASESITDVLGYLPGDVIGLSSFDFFHPDELPFARKVHGKGIHLDRAAMLVYCQVKHKDGRYVNVETIFSVVYDVFVAATSLHVHTSKSQGRALTAPVIRRVFSASPNDPRYHMLTHLSTKFRMERAAAEEQHEPRAALILNRFTRSLTVLYASHALESIFGITPEELNGKSFFECIEEECLQNAVDALERAKENDSIAYLRFRWRDPRERVAEPAAEERPQAQSRRSTRIASLTKRKRDDGENEAGPSTGRSIKRRIASAKGKASATIANAGAELSSTVAGTETDIPARAAASEVPNPHERYASQERPLPAHGERVSEVEAVVSCTSDGLVVILRKARPLIPKPLHDIQTGLFASPWAPAPMVPSVKGGLDPAFEASFMETIREVAVFAWSLHELGGEIVQPGSNAANTAQLVDGEVRESLGGDGYFPGGDITHPADGKTTTLSNIKSALSKTASKIKDSLLPSSSQTDQNSLKQGKEASLTPSSADPSPDLSTSGQSSSTSATTESSGSVRSKSRDTQATDVTPLQKADAVSSDGSDSISGPNSTGDK